MRKKRLLWIQKGCVFCDISIISQEGEEVKGGKNTKKLSLALKILTLCSTCLQNTAASYLQSLCHRPAVSHSLPPPLLLFQPLYIRMRMKNSRKEKSKLIWNRVEVLQKRERRSYWVLKRPNTLDQKTLSHSSLREIICHSYQLCGTYVYLGNWGIRAVRETGSSSTVPVEVTSETNPN